MLVVASCWTLLAHPICGVARTIQTETIVNETSASSEQFSEENMGNLSDNQYTNQSNTGSNDHSSLEEEPNEFSDYLNIEDETTATDKSKKDIEMTGYFGTTEWVFSSNGDLRISSGKFDSGKFGSKGTFFSDTDKGDVKRIIFEGKVTANKNSSSLFQYFGSSLSKHGIKFVNLENFDTSEVENMSYMFAAFNSSYDAAGGSLDLSTFDTSKVTNMEGMFSGCTMLTNLNLSSFDMSNVTEKDDMFFGTLPRILTLGNKVNLSSDINLKNIPVTDNYTGKWANVGNGSIEVPAGEIRWTSEELVENYKSDNADTYVCEALGSAQVRYFDVATRRAIPGVPADMLTGIVGEQYEVAEKEVQGFKFKEYNPAPIGVFQNGSAENIVAWYIKNSANILVKNSTIYVGDEWNPENNFIKATDSEENDVPFNNISVDSSDVDVTNPGEYEVIYSYEDISVTSYVIVKENKAAVNVRDSILYIGEDSFWEPEDNFDSAFDKDGNIVKLSDIAVDDSQMDDPNITKPGEYDIKYSYAGKTSVAHISVREVKLALNVHDSTIYVGDKWKAEYNFDSAFDKDGNPVLLNSVTVSGNVDTNVVGIYPVTYSYLGISKIVEVSVKDKTLGLNVPETVDFGTYRLGDENKDLAWNKENIIEVQDEFNLGWQLVVSLLNTNHLDVSQYLFYNKQNIDMNGIEVSTGTGTEEISQNFQKEKTIYFDYSNVKGLREDKATLEWTLTPSIKGVEE